MPGAMRKVGEYLGLVEQADYEDFEDYEDVPVEREPAQQAAPARPAPTRSGAARSEASRPAPVASFEERRSRRNQVTELGAMADLSRIETVTPRTYNDARTVGEHFRSGVPVIMNLSEIDDDDAKRLVDFAAGLIFSVHGSINRITAKVFLLSPSSISVTDEDKQRLAAGGFYNQS